jgi:hypothetical protein
LFTTVSTVPNRSVGLAQYPAGAAAYHVASPPSLAVGAGGGGGAVVVVVVGGGGGAVVVVVGGSVVVVVVGGAVVVVVAGAVVDVVVFGAWYATRFDGRFTPLRADGCTTCDRVPCALRAAACDRVPCADALCNNRRGNPNNVPQMTAATPRRLPPVLWFRRAPPFSGDSVHPRRHTSGEGILEKLDNQTRTTQTRERTKPFRALFSQVTHPAVRDI